MSANTSTPNSQMQRAGRVDIQLEENSVCHLDTVFGFLQQ